MKYDPDKVTLLIDSHHGVYVPKIFAETVDHKDNDTIDQADIDLLLLGPDTVGYWEAWETIMDNAVITDKQSGQRYILWQPEDLWLVPEGMDVPEY